MADQLNIFTQFVVNPTVAGLTSVSRQLTGIASQITNIGQLFAVVAGGYGIKQMVSGVLELNSGLQDATYGLATLFSAIDHQKFTAGLGLARAEIRGLREDAAKGVGGFDDYLQSYQKIFAPTRQAGASLDQIRELNRLVIAAGFSRGKGARGAQEAALDVVQALTGHASLSITPVVAEALQSVGIDIKAFKHESPTKQLADLMKGFGSFKEAADAMGATWSSRIETLKNYVQNIALGVSSPLFDRWTSDLGQVNDWLEKNRAVLDDISGRIGDRLLYVYDRISKDPGGNFAALLGLAAAGSAAGGLAKGGFSVGAPMIAPAGAAWNAAAGRYQMPSGKFAAPAALGAGFGLEGAVGAVATGGWLAAIAGGIGLVVASVTSAATKFPSLSAHFAGSVGQFTMEAEGLWESFTRLASNPVLTLIGAQVIGFGDILVQAAGKTLRVLSIFADFIAGIGDALIPVFQAMNAASHGQFGAAAGFMSNANTILGLDGTIAMARLSMLFTDLKGPPKIAPGTEAKSDKDRDKPGNITNINGPVNVRIVVEKLDDPDAVASSFEAAWSRLRANPTTGGRARLVPRP